ncbi:hypothetical protein H4P12_08160 [Paracoccus sp. 11-3]|uniref:Uncharacterized protein n=1 Tax=Paracoccus amoyensis TaxID=2760093 RepID=A0A926JC99_9RHOB|nr:glycosyltransferase [Paracoccus amoyensis]MBC9246685.1 hypothetical protein [Paracoccus amoyensis]
MTSFAGPNLDVTQVLLLSLSEAHPKDDIHFWLLHQNIPARKIAALSDFCTKLGNITLQQVQVPDPAAFDNLKVLGGKPDSARFLWFVAHQHLPSDVTRVIYLDALDIVVVDDLVPLLHHPFLGKYLVACREALNIPPLLIGSAQRAHALGMPKPVIQHVGQGLINSGAIVLNLDKFRRDKVEIGDYIKVAEWACNRLNLGFGDQGLFSLTHGSHYTRAHHRYNYRFSYDLPDRSVPHPAVIHYAGRSLPKPMRFAVTTEVERVAGNHLRQSGGVELVLPTKGRIRATHLPYYRLWWDICARTPCHARIAPQATERMTNALAQIAADYEAQRAKG